MKVSKDFLASISKHFSDTFVTLFHPVYLFALDSAPLLIAVGVWVIMWPTNLLAKIMSERVDRTDFTLTSAKY